MKIIRKIIEILICIFITIVILFLNLGSIDVIVNHKDYLYFSKILIALGIILFVLYLAYKVFNKEKIKAKDIIIILLGIFGYISYKYALDKNTALYGGYGRNEGLLVILSYYSIFLSSSCLNKKYQKIVMSVLVFTGILQVFIGSFQIFKVDTIFGYNRSYNISNSYKSASGTFGNPNFYSTYILMCLVYCYFNIFNKNEKKKKYMYIILTLYLIYGLIIGDTLSCILSFLILFIISLIKIINRNNLKIFILSFLILIVIFMNLSYIGKKNKISIIRSIDKNISEVVSIFKDGISDDTGKGRIYVWKKAIEISSSNLINGIGIDNFGIVENGYYLRYETLDGNVKYFDKVHNEYLQKLVTEGIFSFISYISLLGYVVYKFIKNKDDFYKHCLFLTFIAYLIQAIFNISVINVAPVFYIIMGFVSSE